MKSKHSAGFKPSAYALIAIGCALIVLGAAMLIFFLQKSEIPQEFELFADENTTFERLDPIATSDGEVERWSVTLGRGEARAWLFPDGSIFWIERSTGAFSVALDEFASAYHLGADDRSPMLARGFAADGGSDSANAENGSASGLQPRDALIQLPLARNGGLLEGTNYRAQDGQNGSVELAGSVLTISAQNATSDWWCYVGSGDLLGERESYEWLYECTVEKFGDANRATIDGYYYATPDDYEPSGDGCYYLNPAAYIALKLAEQADSRDGQNLALALLDLQREHYNSLGFVPTAPQSGWLSRDYGLPSGFYDTRFNTDLAAGYLALSRALGIEEFEQIAQKYAEFFLDHAENHHFETQNGGILVCDYSHPDGGEPTHVSLNHQLSEILFLLQLGGEDESALAQKMLLGIEDTQEDWVRSDGDLHYARYPDGSFGGADYPYLTYNDLLALDRFLGGSECLRSLMQTKKLFMDENDIKDYDK